MKKYLILFTLLIFIFVGCVPKNVVVTESAVTPTVTKIIPSSTPTLIKPTPTIYLSPLPTLSWSPAFQKLYKSEFECDKPCLWGIIPGVSTWTETEQFINQFHTGMYKYQGAITDNNITKSKFSDTCHWYVINPMPNTDYYPSVDIEVQNNVVLGIKIPDELVWYFFPTDKLLEEYGKPNKVLIEIEESSSLTHNFATIYILYEDKRIMTGYSFSSLKTNESLSNLCLFNYYFEELISERQMVLWSSTTELNFDFSDLKPLEQISELSTETFYEKFKEENNKCFEVLKSAWE